MASVWWPIAVVTVWDGASCEPQLLTTASCRWSPQKGHALCPGASAPAWGEGPVGRGGCPRSPSSVTQEGHRSHQRPRAPALPDLPMALAGRCLHSSHKAVGLGLSSGAWSRGAELSGLPAEAGTGPARQPTLQRLLMELVLHHLSAAGGSLCGPARARPGFATLLCCHPAVTLRPGSAPKASWSHETCSLSPTESRDCVRVAWDTGRSAADGWDPQQEAPRAGLLPSMSPWCQPGVDSVGFASWLSTSAGVPLETVGPCPAEHPEECFPAGHLQGQVRASAIARSVRGLRGGAIPK